MQTPFPLHSDDEELERELDFFFMGGPRVLIPFEQVLAELDREFGDGSDQPDSSDEDE